MAARTLYLVRHGAADAWGQLTDEGREQSRLVGRRLSRMPIDVVWHSPLARAVESAQIIAAQMPRVLLDEAAELVDHVPFVPDSEDLSPSWTGFFDGYDRAEAEAGRRSADELAARFGTPNIRASRPTHEVAVTHAYPIAWMVRDALGAPPARWMSLGGVANTGPCERSKRLTHGVRRLRRCARLSAADKLDENRQIQGTFAREVGVDRASGQPRPLGDPIDLGRTVPELAEFLPRRSQHRCAGVCLLLSPRHPGHGRSFPP